LARTGEDVGAIAHERIAAHTVRRGTTWDINRIGCIPDHEAADDGAAFFFDGCGRTL
jgi:hypothetical protein